MAKIWKNRLEAGTQKWEDCPEKYRAEVKRLLRQDVKSRTITKKEYKAITGETY